MPGRAGGGRWGRAAVARRDGVAGVIGVALGCICLRISVARARRLVRYNQVVMRRADSLPLLFAMFLLPAVAHATSALDLCPAAADPCVLPTDLSITSDHDWLYDEFGLPK